MPNDVSPGVDWSRPLPEPVSSRPRMFGGELEPTKLPWSWAQRRLDEARHYWIATTRPDGRPHARPVWGVWLDGRFCFSTGSLAAGNLAANPRITVHVENARGEAVIVEGTAVVVDDGAFLRRVLDAYNPKYRSDLGADALPGPFHAVVPGVVFGWVSDPSGGDAGAAFHGTATRWTAPRASAPADSAPAVDAQ